MFDSVGPNSITSQVNGSYLDDKERLERENTHLTSRVSDLEREKTTLGERLEVEKGQLRTDLRQGFDVEKEQFEVQLRLEFDVEKERFETGLRNQLAGEKTRLESRVRELEQQIAQLQLQTQTPMQTPPVAENTSYMNQLTGLMAKIDEQLGRFEITVAEGDSAEQKVTLLVEKLASLPIQAKRHVCEILNIQADLYNNATADQLDEFIKNKVKELNTSMLGRLWNGISSWFRRN